MERRAEGIIISVIPYQDRHEIASVFTPYGMISLIRKWGRGPKKSPLSPLTRCEFIWKEGQGELGTVEEIHLLDPFLRHRDSLKSLQCAMECLSAIKLTQQINQPAERLYQLLLKIIEALPDTEQKATLLSAFYLKLMIHEGTLPIESLTLEMAELAACRSIQTFTTTTLSREEHEAIKMLFEESIR